MKNKKTLPTQQLIFRQVPRNYQANGTTAENASAKLIVKKIYPLMSPNKKINGNKSLILTLIDKEKYLLNLLLKKNSTPKKIYRLNKCFFLKKKHLFSKLIKNYAVFFNFHKSLNNEFTPYFTHSTTRLKKNKPLVSTKVKHKNFFLIRPPRSIKSKLINETLSPKQYSNNLQQTTHKNYYCNNIPLVPKSAKLSNLIRAVYPIPRRAKAKLVHRRSRGEIALLPLKIYIAKRKHVKLQTRNFTCNGYINRLFKQNNAYKKQSYKARVDTVISKVNTAYFPYPVEKILRLKNKLKNKSLTILEKPYELFNKKSLEEKKIVTLNNQLFNIKKDTEALLQFSKKILMSNKLPTTKTYAYDFL